MRFGKSLTFFVTAIGLVLALPLGAQQKPLTKDQVHSLVRSGLADESGAKMVEQRGIDFDARDDYLNEVRAAGGDDELINAFKHARVTKPATVDAAAGARQAEVKQHVARGAEFSNQQKYAEAEQEYRTAATLDTGNASYQQNYEGLLQRVKE